MKKNKMIIFLLSSVFVVSLTGGWFYWFQWRPVQIRKNCYQKSYAKYEKWRELNKSNNKNEWKAEKEWINNPLNNNNNDWGWWYPAYAGFTEDFVFSDCLLRNGLKAELPNLEQLKQLKNK